MVASGFSVPRRLQGYHLRLCKGERRQAVRQFNHGLQRNGRGHDADMGIFCQQQRYDLVHIAGTAADECVSGGWQTDAGLRRAAADHL